MPFRAGPISATRCVTVRSAIRGWPAKSQLRISRIRLSDWLHRKAHDGRNAKEIVPHAMMNPNQPRGKLRSPTLTRQRSSRCLFSSVSN
jgi:hypothetical protein